MDYKVHWISVCLLYGVVHHNNAYMYEGYDVYRRPETHDVTSVPGLEFLPPYYSNYGSGENNQIILRCKVRSDVQPNFMWEKIDSITSEKITINVIGNSRYSIGLRKWPDQQYTSKLLIRNTEASDSGIFKCRVDAGGTKVLERQFKVSVQESVLSTTRLESYTQEGEGLVEVLQENKWNRFDFRGFSTIEASLVCRSLGYPYGGVPRNRLIDDKPVFETLLTSRRNRHRMCIFGLRCSPNATDISQCDCPEPKTDCMFLVGVTCRLQPIEIPDVPVRLTVKIPGMDLKNLREGVVEVFFNGHWGFVCFNGSNGPAEVNALCHTLGFRFGGLSYKKQYVYLSNNSLDMTREYLQNITCPENAMHFDECRHTDWGERCEATSCGCDLGVSMALAIRCWTDMEMSMNPEVRVRLAGSNTENEGRVELYNNNIWGTLADTSIGNPEADVFCRMMGYRYGGVPKYNFPPGKGQMWIDDITCPPNADDLQECSFEWESGTVWSMSAVGVKCRTEPIEG
ncbi:neurotrypsin-like [Mytilus trossulus]|uniref:neurotrypsin-like n=1 Tax=Mytilus trossulus TaxID=6551 RepID=UPI003004FE99